MMGQTTLYHADLLPWLSGRLWLVENGFIPKFHAAFFDPPYFLGSISKRYGKQGSAVAHPAKNGIFRYDTMSKGFMGKRWDGFESVWHYQAWVTEWASLMLGFLYPGAVIAVFGGTRTYHRIAAGLEDAGFTITDVMSYMYGSGFPKSHDISKAIDRAAGAERDVIRPQSYELANDGGYSGGLNTNKPRSLSAELSAPSTPDAIRWNGYGTSLKPAYEPLILARSPLAISAEPDIIVANLSKLEAQLWLVLHVSTAESNSTLNQAVLNAALDTAQWTVERLTNTRDALRGQMDMSQFVLAMTLSLNTVSSWLNILDALSNLPNTSTIGTALSTTIDWKTLNYSTSQITPESILHQVSRQLGFGSNAPPAESHLIAVSENMNAIQQLFAAGRAISSVRENLEDAASLPDLTPNYEPVILARAPRGSNTFADLAQQFGSGALNVDGGRVGMSQDDHEAYLEKRVSFLGTNGSDGWKRTSPDNPLEVQTEKSLLGRWPANIILDDVAAALLNKQSGELVSRYGAPAKSGGDSWFDAGDFGGQHDDIAKFIGDSGGASRFFYTAKSATWEREAGLHHHEQTTVNDGRKTPIDNPYQRGETKRRNTHPTVKPIRLNEYIARLLLPPVLNEPRRILIPFGGVGSEVIGALLAGWDQVVSIEREAEYIPLHRERVTWWQGFKSYEQAESAYKADMSEEEQRDNERAHGLEQLSIFDTITQEG